MAANRRPARSLKDVDLLTEDRRRRHARQIWVVSLGRFTQVQSVELSSESLTSELRKVYFFDSGGNSRFSTSKHPWSDVFNKEIKHIQTSEQNEGDVFDKEIKNIQKSKKSSWGGFCSDTPPEN